LRTAHLLKTLNGWQKFAHVANNNIYLLDFT
jgi:hypothetical protein